MKKKSKKTGCLVAFIALWILGLIGILAFNTLTQKEEIIETIQVAQPVETIKVEEKDIRYQVLNVDTLGKISQIMRVDEVAILKAYGLDDKQSALFKPELGQQIDILADVTIVEKDHQLMAIVEAEGGTKREILIAKPGNLKMKDIVGTGTILVVTESDHQIAEAILVEQDEQIGLLVEKGNAVPKMVAIPTVEKDIKTATEEDLKEAVDEEKANTIKTTVPKDKPKKPIKVEKDEIQEKITNQEKDKETPKVPTKVDQEIHESSEIISTDGDTWVEFTEQYNEDYTEEVPKYKEVEIVRNQIYYFDKEGKMHDYGWYDEVKQDEAYEKFMKEETQDGQDHYRDVVVETRQIQVGVETVTKTRIGERQVWRNERTGQVVYKKP